MRKLFVLCLSIFVGTAVYGQPSDKFTGSLLWKISGNGLEKPSYILGTHHFYSVDDFDTIAGARTALEASSQVVGELLLADQVALATQSQLAAIMPQGESYRTLLSTGDYEALDNGLKGLMGMGMEQLGTMKPGMISAVLSAIMFSQANPGYNPQTHVGMDIFVQNYATEKGSPVVGLESIEEQVHLMFDAEPIKVQAERLACSVRNVDYGVESIKKLGESYAAGDLAKMYNDLLNNPDDPCPSTEAYNNAMAKERNDRWLEKLPGIMSGAPSFIAVGALHLAGEEGLLFQLDKMGYTVEAVKQ